MSKEKEYVEDASVTLCIIDREFPQSRIHGHHDAPSCASHGGALSIQPSSKPLDVPNGVIHKDFEGLCAFVR